MIGRLNAPVNPAKNRSFVVSSCRHLPARAGSLDARPGSQSQAVEKVCLDDGLSAAVWRLLRPVGTREQRRICAGRGAGGVAFRRLVGLLRRGAGAVAGLLRACRWAQSLVPGGEPQPSRRPRWPTSIFCPGSGRPPMRWLRGGPLEIESPRRCQATARMALFHCWPFWAAQAGQTITSWTTSWPSPPGSSVWYSLRLPVSLVRTNVFALIRNGYFLLRRFRVRCWAGVRAGTTHWHN